MSVFKLRSCRWCNHHFLSAIATGHFGKSPAHWPIYFCSFFCALISGWLRQDDFDKDQQAALRSQYAGLCWKEEA